MRFRENAITSFLKGYRIPYIGPMQTKALFLFLVLAAFFSKAQNNVPDFVAASDEGYFELYELKDAVEVIRITSQKSSLKTDTIQVESVKLFKKEFRPNIIRAASKLEKGWMGQENVTFSSSKNYLFSLKFLKNGERDYWYVNGTDPYESFWCRTTEKVNYLIREHDAFDVVFTTYNDKLGAFWIHRSKGPEGYSARLFEIK